MKRVEIRIRDNDDRAKALFDFLRSLDFVEMTVTSERESKTRVVDDEAFFALAGIWEGRDISLETIRRKAWSEQSA